MNVGSLGSLCMRCKLSLSHPRPVDSWLTLVPRRYRSDKASGKRQRFEVQHPPKPVTRSGTFDWSASPRKSFKFEGKPKLSPLIRPKAQRYDPPPPLKPEQVPDYFEKNVRNWADNKDMQKRLLAFGIPEKDLDPLLDAFVNAVQSQSLSAPGNYAHYELERFAETFSLRQTTSIIYSTIFYTWATDPSQRTLLTEKYEVQPKTIDQMTALANATDRRFMAEHFVNTRRMHRKVIMHVGPTNSGKTHWALRALAAANVGVYAGPLRLLAHEIWERLNLGHIAPLGAEDPSFKNADAHLLASLPHLSTVQQLGKPEHARLTNMITGEEQKIVSLDARLLSCTVEMLNFHQKYDVAVVDEIQMISDPQRGSAWTSAVLGLAASEVHLCGEETAVPIVETLLKNTGDELIIKRYERLTPLTIEDKSLGGDFSKIRKGDCIVAFSRSGIFAIKKRVEAATGLRCAVVYGRLPPEIRSEQAALFNDRDSGYDVIVGSDAIGMGLNLKIRRIIFDAVRKHEPAGEVLLSISQVKQIAGRAGRFGLHGDEIGGFATTLQEQDLPYLKQAVETPFHALPYARITFDAETFSKLLPILPPNSSTSTVIHAHQFTGRLPPKVRHQDTDFDMVTTFDFIDEFADALTIKERVLHLNAPVGWRDPLLVAMIRKFLEQARDKMYVDLPSALRTTKFVETMEHIEKAMKDEHVPRSNLRDLSTLESFHKSLILYIWMAFRAPILYPQYELASSLKARLERVLEWSLEGMSDSRYLKSFRTQERGVGKSDSLENGKPRPKIVAHTSKYASKVAREQAADVASNTITS